LENPGPEDPVEAGVENEFVVEADIGHDARIVASEATCVEFPVPPLADHDEFRLCFFEFTEEATFVGRRG